MAKIKTAWVLFGLLFACTAAAQGYQDIDPPQPTRSGDNIEMIEVFLYTCPHCYDFEPYLEKWLENKPQDVEFRRIPGVFRKDSIPHAKAFYTAEKLNVLDKVHQPLFDAIHLRKQKIHGERALKKFFTRHGVDGGEFTRVYNSAEVDDMVKQAFLLAQHYKVAGVPSIIINGKYLVSGNLAGSLANMLEVAAELIEKERRLLQQP